MIKPEIKYEIMDSLVESFFSKEDIIRFLNTSGFKFLIVIHIKKLRIFFGNFSFNKEIIDSI